MFGRRSISTPIEAEKYNLLHVFRFGKMLRVQRKEELTATPCTSVLSTKHQRITCIQWAPNQQCLRLLHTDT